MKHSIDTDESTQASTPPRPIIRYAWLTLAGICIAAGAVGVILPGIPTTPFLLVAAWSAPKGSPRLNFWLHNHKKFGPMIRAWKNERAIPRSAKITGICMMLISLVVMWWMKLPLMFITIACVFFTCGACALMLFKEPSKEWE